MKKHKYILRVMPSIIIVLFLSMIFYYRYRVPGKTWYCSPTSPRGSDLQAWENMINSELPVDKVDANFFNKFTVNSDDEKLTIEFPYEEPKENPFAFEICEMTADKPLDIGGGTIEFFGFGIAYPDVNQSVNDEIKYDFYDAHFQPANMEKTGAFWYYRMSEQKGRFQYKTGPSVQFGFEYQGIEDIMFNNIKLLDSRTHKPVNNGYSSSGIRIDDRSTHRFTIDISLWHRAPVDLVFDVSFGPSRTFEFLPQAGEGFKADNFECRLVSALEGIDPGFLDSMLSYDGKEIHEFRKSTSEDKGLCFFFACQPTANQMPVTFECLDENGKVLFNNGSSSSGNVHDIIMKQPLEEIAAIRAKYRPHRCRIIFHLPFIPGLPEKNSNIEDLFDVYVPCISFKDFDYLDRFLRQTLQLNFSYRTGQKPADSIQNMTFPKDFKDVSIRDIAIIYSTGGTLNIDVENDLLELNYPLPLRVKIEQFLQKILQRQK